MRTTERTGARQTGHNAAEGNNTHDEQSAKWPQGSSTQSASFWPHSRQMPLRAPVAPEAPESVGADSFERDACKCEVLFEFGTITELTKWEERAEDGAEIVPVNELTLGSGTDSLDSKVLVFVLVVPVA